MRPALEYKLLHPLAVAPTYALSTTGILPLHACLSRPVALLRNAAPVNIPCGIALDFQDPTVLAILFPAPGWSAKLGVVFPGGLEIREAGNKAEWQLALANRGSIEQVIVRPGNIIAHARFVPAMNPVLREAALYDAWFRRQASR